MDASSSSSSFVPCSKKPFLEPPISSPYVPCAPEPYSAPLTASSSKKPKSEPPTLTSLPDELVARIIVAVAATGWNGDFFRVAGLSKQFRRLSEDPSVLRSADPYIYKNSIWISRSYQERLFQGCLASGNPHAQFVQGNDDYFLNQRREIGLKLLISSANQGHQKAIYVCGMLLLCLGGLDKQKGMKLLSTLMDPISIYSSMYVVGNLRRSTELPWWPVGYGADTMHELKQLYVRDPCCCNGKTSAFVELGALQRYRRVIHGKDLPASEACLICFWDHQVQRFFLPWF